MLPQLYLWLYQTMVNNLRFYFHNKNNKRDMFCNAEWLICGRLGNISRNGHSVSVFSRIAFHLVEPFSSGCPTAKAGIRDISPVSPETCIKARDSPYGRKIKIACLHGDRREGTPDSARHRQERPESTWKVLLWPRTAAEIRPLQDGGRISGNRPKGCLSGRRALRHRIPSSHGRKIARPGGFLLSARASGLPRSIPVIVFL